MIDTPITAEMVIAARDEYARLERAWRNSQGRTTAVIPDTATVSPGLVIEHPLARDLAEIERTNRELAGDPSVLFDAEATS